jgi:hypothetical protein
VPLERAGGQLVADLVVDHRLSCEEADDYIR